jgi:hypothetical protein
LSAQTVIGDMPATINFYSVPPVSGGRTVVDLTHFATEPGTLTDALVRWYSESGPCANAFTLRFFRPSGSTFILVAERGPFSTTAGEFVNVTLSPPVEVVRKDVIGIYLQGPQSCGGISGGYGTGNLLSFNGDYKGGPIAGASPSFGDRLAMRASTATPPLVGIVPVVGFVQGNFGSVFRTRFQVTNPGEATLQDVKFVFRRPGTTWSPSDPSTTLTLPPHSTNTSDLLTAMGATGLGSLDVYTTNQYAPAVSAHIFNDAGAAGTNGFLEPMIPVAAALRPAQSSEVIFPSDLTNYRMNVGIRTLGSETKISMAIYDAQGNVTTGSHTVTYPANYFAHMSLQQFLDAVGGAASPAGRAAFQVSTGALIVYSTTTDNRTNDSAMTVLTPRN